MLVITKLELQSLNISNLWSLAYKSLLVEDLQILRPCLKSAITFLNFQKRDAPWFTCVVHALNSQNGKDTIDSFAISSKRRLFFFTVYYF
jgi:hypothetical protein